MASDNTKKNTLPANMRVKIEPGTSASSVSLEPSESLPHIKIEPNTQPAPVQRLTSFRVPRDLTLGGNIKLEKPKKVYTPNVNVQRNKRKNQPLLPKVQHEVVRTTDERGRGRGNRGRGERGRGKPNTIESTGVWSYGTHAPSASRKYSSDSNSDSVRVKSEKPKSNKVTNTDKMTEAADLERLTKLALNDDSDEDEEDDERPEPLSLPRDNENKSRRRNKMGKQQRLRMQRKVLAISEENNASSISENKALSDALDKNPRLKELQNKPNSFVLLQLPDCLPGCSSLEKEETKPGKSSNCNDSDEDDDNAKAGRCTLNDLKEGRLGSFQILESGKTRIRIGNTYFNVNFGTDLKCRQDVMAVKVDTELSTGDSLHLGTVDDKLIVSPDLTQMLDDPDFIRRLLS